MRGATGGAERGARWRRTFAGLTAAVALGVALPACSAVHNTLGTTNGPCFVALPTAVQAVGTHGHLEGVRLDKVGKIPYPGISAALAARGMTSGRVCLVAFTGRFSASSVSRPVGPLRTGRFAVVVLSYPGGRLVATLLFRKVPVRFGHTHVA